MDNGEQVAGNNLMKAILSRRLDEFPLDELIVWWSFRHRPVIVHRAKFGRDGFHEQQRGPSKTVVKTSLGAARVPRSRSRSVDVGWGCLTIEASIPTCWSRLCAQTLNAETAGIAEGLQRLRALRELRV